MNVAGPLIAGLALVALQWYGRRLGNRRLREMAELRKLVGDPGRAVFFAYLADCGLAPRQAQKVYRYFQEWTGVDDFPVELDDELRRGLGMCGLDVDDTAEEIARLCDCKVAPDAVFGDSQSVRDLLSIALADRRKGIPWWCGDGETAETHSREPETL
jgi:hypothetical protein